MPKAASYLLRLEERLTKGLWFRRALAVFVAVLTIRLTHWGMAYADHALVAKAALLDVAAVIAAVAGIPVALVTLLFNKYVENRTNGNTRLDNGS